MYEPTRVAVRGPQRGHRRRTGGLALALLSMTALLAPSTVGASAVAPVTDTTRLAPTAASWCSSSVGTPTIGRSGTTIVADNFESGSLSTKWSKTDEGDAWAGVTNSWAKTGGCAGRLIVSSSYTSRANIRRGLPSGTDEVWATGYFRINKQGAWGSNVPTFRLFNGNTRIIDLHRLNGSGKLDLRSRTSSGGWRYVNLGRYIELGRWYYIELHVKAAYGSSLVSVWLNGTMLYRSYSYPLVTSRLTTVMIGAEHVRQVMDLGFDNVVVKAQ